jgi:ATP-dependent RNA helicase UAP56/SUB2
MMFSATISDETRNTCRAFMNNPFELYVDSESKLTLHGLKQYFVNLEDDKKIKKLIELLDNLDFNQVIIFSKNMQYA